MTKDELRKILSSFCDENAPLEYELTEEGKRIYITITGDKDGVADAFYVTPEVLESDRMGTILLARLAAIAGSRKGVAEEG